MRTKHGNVGSAFRICTECGCFSPPALNLDLVYLLPPLYLNSLFHTAARTVLWKSYHMTVLPQTLRRGPISPEAKDFSGVYSVLLMCTGRLLHGSFPLSPSPWLRSPHCFPSQEVPTRGPFQGLPLRGTLLEMLHEQPHATFKSLPKGDASPWPPYLELPLAFRPLPPILVLLCVFFHSTDQPLLYSMIY